MSNIEKIKFGDQAFDLVAAGVNLGEGGGTITFQMGDSSFDAIESLLKANGDIKQIGLSGAPDWSRSDLVYAGKLSKISDYEVGVAEDGLTAITADVVTATFRTPDLTDKVAAQAAEIETLKATVDMLVLSSLEG